MQRRSFLTLLGSAAAACPLAARAQQPAMPVIGFLSGATLETTRDPVVMPFRRGLSETGYVEDRNVSIEYRWAEGQNDRLPELASELVRRQVALIVIGGSTPGTLAAKAATTSIPIVFLIGTDPVAIGIVPSLARPAGNITGYTVINAQLIAKEFEMLRELVPAVRTIGMLVNPTNRLQTETELKEAQIAAAIFDMRLVVVTASTPGEIEPAFATLVASRVGALLVSGELFFTTQRDHVIGLAARHALPAVYANREFTAAGGLMNYGTSIPEGARQVGIYAGRILKGDKPSDLPVQQAARVELIINMKTAKALGLTFPLTLLGRADEVIE